MLSEQRADQAECRGAYGSPVEMQLLTRIGADTCVEIGG